MKYQYQNFFSISSKRLMNIICDILFDYLHCVGKDSCKEHNNCTLDSHKTCTHHCKSRPGRPEKRFFAKCFEVLYGIPNPLLSFIGMDKKIHFDIFLQPSRVWKQLHLGGFSQTSSLFSRSLNKQIIKTISKDTQRLASSISNPSPPSN